MSSFVSNPKKEIHHCKKYYLYFRRGKKKSGFKKNLISVL